MQQRNKLGQFKRLHKKWSLENFDDGYIGSDGRFRVYFPEHERAYKNGYILRSIVAYEAYYKERLSRDYAIHHKDGDRLNDKKENLEKIKFGKHSSLHNDKRKNGKYFKCIVCKKIFYKPQWRLNMGHTGKFCSLDCYYKAGGSQYKRRYTE